MLDDRVDDGDRIGIHIGSALMAELPALDIDILQRKPVLLGRIEPLNHRRDVTTQGAFTADALRAASTFALVQHGRYLFYTEPRLATMRGAHQGQVHWTLRRMFSTVWHMNSGCSRHDPASSNTTNTSNVAWATVNFMSKQSVTAPIWTNLLPSESVGFAVELTFTAASFCALSPVCSTIRKAKHCLLLLQQIGRRFKRFAQASHDWDTRELDVVLLPDGSTDFAALPSWAW